MALKKIGHFFALILFAGIAFPVYAQTSIPVRGTVRNERGELLTSARIRATATDVDTTVRTNDRGEFLVNLPRGNATLAVSNLGHEEQRRNVEINATTGRVDFILRAIARALAQVDVRDNWIGIRGGIGDDGTRNPIADATIIVPKLKLRVKTDSNGRFEIPLPNAENAVLQIEQPGYQTRIVGIEVQKSGATDVVLFLKAGKDVLGYKTQLSDLQRRAVANRQRMFMAGRNELLEKGRITLYDAIVDGGLLAKTGLKFIDDGEFCLLIDGKPRFKYPLSAVRMDDVELVEVYGYGAEHTNSLFQDWPRNSFAECKDPKYKIVGAELKRYVQWVAVWTRK